VHVSVAQWLVLSATVVAAATVQGVVGFGSNLLAVPVVALIMPSALPGAMVFPGVPMAVTMAAAERDHVDWRGSRFLVLGRLPGTLIGVAVVAAVSTDLLAVVIGVVVILGVALSVAAAHLHPGVTPATAAVTGVATGITGTAAAIDGPPLPTGSAAGVPRDARDPVRARVGDHPRRARAGRSPARLAGAARLLAHAELLRRSGTQPGYPPRLAHRNLRPAMLTIAALTGMAAIVRAVA
jgi:hypothetical protein